MSDLLCCQPVDSGSVYVWIAAGTDMISSSSQMLYSPVVPVLGRQGLLSRGLVPAGRLRLLTSGWSAAAPAETSNVHSISLRPAMDQHTKGAVVTTTVS